jgi:hypothetical protein
MDLAGRPPLGPKPPKKPKGPRKPIPRQSAKRKAYLASDARVEGLAHMERVAALPCLVCGAWPVEVHHEDTPRSDFNVLPLCPPHHRREFGPGAYHYSPKAFYALHGTSEGLLGKVSRILAGGRASFPTGSDAPE